MPKAPTAVMSPAGNKGMPKRRLRASAAPMNSARSVAIAITSACIHKASVTGRGKRSAHLGEVLARGDPKLGRHRLDEHRHEVRRQDYPQEHIPVARPSRDIGGEVA